MPIYTYTCRACSHPFELLVRSGTTPACPECNGTDLERHISATALGTETTSGLAMRAARKRDARQADQMNRAQREYEEHHDDH